MAEQKNNKVRNRWLYRSLLTVAFGLIAVGIYILVMPWWIRHNQDQISSQLLELVDSTVDEGEDPDLIWVDPDAWVNSDEEVDYFIPDPSDPDKFIEISPPVIDKPDRKQDETIVVTNPSAAASDSETSPDNDGTQDSITDIATPTPEATNSNSTGETGTTGTTTLPNTSPGATNSQGQVGLQGIGKLVMDKIGVNIPIVTGLTRVHLRYAAAHYEITPMIGDKGLSTIFAHRSPQHGRDLNRLNEIKVGDKFEIVRNGQTYHYVTEQNIIVEPNQVLEYIFGDYNDDSYLMLVTCHPIPTWEQRMLVIARLIEVT